MNKTLSRTYICILLLFTFWSADGKTVVIDVDSNNTLDTIVQNDVLVEFRLDNSLTHVLEFSDCTLIAEEISDIDNDGIVEFRYRFDDPGGVEYTVLIYPGLLQKSGLTVVGQGSTLKVLPSQIEKKVKRRSLLSNTITQYEILTLPPQNTETERFFEIYPNPNSGAFSIEMSKDIDFRTDVKYTVVSITGRTIADGMFNGKLKQVDHQMLATGIYLLHLEWNDQSQTIKFKVAK
jgi:hypothetical protein